MKMKATDKKKKTITKEELKAKNELIFFLITFLTVLL